MDSRYALLTQAMKPLLPFLTDSTFEVMINKPGEVWTDTKAGVQCHNIDTLTARSNVGLLNMLASSRYKKCDVAHPILQDTWVHPDTQQPWRVTGVLPPVTNHVAFNFRRLNVKPLTTEKLIHSHYFEKEVMALQNGAEVGSKTLRNTIVTLFKHAMGLSGDQQGFKKMPPRYETVMQAILSKRNIVISGATGSSKTQFLNWCLSQIPQDERIITIEDTQELVLTQPNHVQLYYPDDPTQSDCPVTADRLLRLVLRMKPSRIIMGEVRGTELVTMLMQANTGHPGTLMTIHTNSPAQARRRMRDILLQVYPDQKTAVLDGWIADLVDMIVQVKRVGHYFFIDDIWQKESVGVQTVVT